MAQYGTLSVLDDLATANETIANFGEGLLSDRFKTALVIHNAAFAEMVSELATFTDRFLLPYGGSTDAIIDELDEWGSADASKPSGAGNLALPLRIYGGTLQWTRSYMNTYSVAKAAEKLDAFATADIKSFQRNVKRVLFKPTNTLNYVDRLQTGLTGDLLALLNADSGQIPNGPNGETFDGATHTHYIGSATLTEASLIALIGNVVEHGIDGEVRLYIARANEAAVRGFTGSFSPYVDARVTVVGAANIGNQALDTNSPDDRAIGVFAGAEVWVKPWIPTSYQAVIDYGATQKALAIRTRTGALTGTGAFEIQAESEQHPLRAQNIGREYGVGVLGRHKAAVQYSGNATYAAPTFT